MLRALILKLAEANASASKIPNRPYAPTGAAPGLE